MTGMIDFVHHVGHFAEDSDAAFAAYRRLGFVLTPLSLHRGADRPGAPMRLLGSANRCAIFDGSYLEITARVAVDNDGRGEVRGRSEFLDRYEGLHIICLGADDMRDVEARISSAGFDTNGVTPLEREVETPEGVRTAKFERVRLVAPSGPPQGEHLQVANHLTPEVIFQPRYMAHPNGAVTMSEVLFCVADPDEYAHRYARFTGREAERRAEKLVIPLVHTRLSFVAAEHLPRVLSGAQPPVLPCIAAFAVAVSDLSRTEALLRGNAVPFDRDGGRIIVPAGAGSGAAVIFEAAVQTGGQT